MTKTKQTTRGENTTQHSKRFLMIKNMHSKTYKTALEQGKVDLQMQSLCSFIESTQKYYTSSCCSGRIILLEKRGEKKKENFFHRKWHRTITEQELLDGLQENVLGELWFKVDPFILHIGCGTLEQANKILRAMKNAGIKRGGIILAQEDKYIIELQGTERISIPIKLAGSTLATENYLLAIVAKANEMLEKNYKKLYRLESEFRKELEKK